MESHQALHATVHIGKLGLTTEIIDEIKRQLKQRKMIKIKMQSAFLEGKNKKDVIADIVDKTDALLVHHVGFIVVLQKK